MSPSAKRRLAALLLLVYPVGILISNAATARRYGGFGYLLYRLPIAILVAATAVAVWRGARWGLRVAPALAAALATIIPLYLGVIYATYGVTRLSWVAVDLLVPCCAAAALVLLLRSGPEGRGAFRRLPGTLAFELACIAAIAVVGIGGFPGGRAWYREALELTQLPAYLLLQAMGFCCGYENETIVSDALSPRWGGIVREGLPALIVANAFALLPVVAVLRWVLRRARGRGVAARS